MSRADSGDAVLHQLWTWAVGREGYDKEKWKQLEVLVHRGLFCAQEDTETTKELERARVQLAGCLIAAEGNATGWNDCREGDYGWSLAFGVVKELRRKWDNARQGCCMFAGPGRGDCENSVGLPGESIPEQHDGDDDTVDVYGKPNGWCWACWNGKRIRELEARHRS